MMHGSPDAAHGVSLDIQGEFEHSFLYKGSLFAIGGDNVLRVASIDETIDEVFRNHPGRRDLAHDLLRGITKHQLEHKYDQSDTTSLTSRKFEINSTEWRTIKDLDSDLKSGQVVDLTIYFDRLYISTSRGLFHFNLEPILDWQDNNSSRAIQRSDAYTFSTSVKFACVVSSCGSDGIMAWASDFSNSGWSEMPSSEKAISSMRSSWIGNRLLNYPSFDHADSLVTHPEKQADDNLIVKDLGTLDFGRDSRFLHYQNNRVDIELMYNAGSKFAFVDTSGFLSFEDRQFSRQYGYSKTVFGNSQRKATVGQPYGAFALTPFVPEDEWTAYDNHRIGINTETGVYLADKNTIRIISNEEAVTCKSFPSSQKYRATVSIVNDSSIRLHAPLPIA